MPLIGPVRSASPAEAAAPGNNPERTAYWLRHLEKLTYEERARLGEDVDSRAEALLDAMSDEQPELPFADAHREDSDSQIGQFVKRCQNAPRLQMVTSSTTRLDCDSELEAFRQFRSSCRSNLH
jgi:hypothetical protein